MKENGTQSLAPRVVRLNDAAQMLAMSPKSVRRLIDRKRLRRIEGSRYVLISLKEIEDFINRAGIPKQEETRTISR